jgi:ech hydrogenase subunit A
VTQFWPGKAAEAPAEFVLDGLSTILVLVVSIIGSVIVVYAIGYMKRHAEHAPPTAASSGRFFFFLVGFLGVMNGLVLADDLRWLSIFWEATTLCSFALIGHDGTKEAQRNAKRALLVNSLGGTAMLGASAILVASGLSESISGPTGIMAAKAMLPMALLCVAALTKSAQMPFQSWLLGAMVAPTPVSALLHSATMVKAGSYLILRLAPAFAGTKLMYVIAIAGAFTFALASALAVSQSNAKKVLAYSTIANLGLIVTCAGINTPLAYAAALMILCFHAISKGLLFLCVGTIEQSIGSRDIEDMGGIMFKMPLTTIITLVGMVSMLIPPFGMLLSKWMAIEAAIYSPLILLLIALGSALTVLFWAKWLGRIQTVSFHEHYQIEKMPLTMLVSKAALAAGVVLAGLTAVPIYKYFIEPLSRHAYAGQALSPTSEALLKSVGEFMAWPVLLFLGLGLLAAIFITRSFKASQVRLPFMCGENAETTEGEGKTYGFHTLKDQRETAWMGTFYLKGIFQESRLTLWANLAAWLIVAAMFGVIRVW